MSTGSDCLVDDYRVRLSCWWVQDSGPTDRYVTSICWSGIRIMCPSGVTYLSVGPESDNVSEWGDISICWSGIRIMCPSGGDISICWSVLMSTGSDCLVNAYRVRLSCWWVQGQIVLLMITGSDCLVDEYRIPDQQIDMSPPLGHIILIPDQQIDIPVLINKTIWPRTHQQDNLTLY
jgi:hypothetical protein